MSLMKRGTNGLMKKLFWLIKSFMEEEFQLNMQVIEKDEHFFGSSEQCGSDVKMYGPGQSIILNTTGHTLLWQLEGTSCIEVTDGAPRTVMADDKVIVHREREFVLTREAGARVLVRTVQQ